MKHTVTGLLIVLPLFFSATSLPAQESGASNAAQIAERREMEELYKKYNTVTSDLQQVLSTQLTLQRKLAALEEEMRAQRTESAREAGRYVTRDDLKRIDTELIRLATTLKEVDQKREADKKLMLETLDQMRVALEEMRKLIKAAAAAPAPRPSAPRAEDAPPAPPRNIKAFEHKVESGQYLGVIIQAYNEKLKEEGVAKRITLDMVMKANPGLKPERMQVGQVILIPDPRD